MSSSGSYGCHSAVWVPGMKGKRCNKTRLGTLPLCLGHLGCDGQISQVLYIQHGYTELVGMWLSLWDLDALANRCPYPAFIFVAGFCEGKPLSNAFKWFYLYNCIYIHLCSIACTFYVHWHGYSMRDWHLQVPTKIDKSIRPSDSFPVLDRRQLESLGMMKLDSVCVSR